MNSVWVGDVMPYGKEGKFFIYHQRDTRNPVPFGEPFGWALATTKDFVHFEDFGESLLRGDDNERDQFIYAGSVFEANGKVHAFYTGYNREFLAQGKTSQVLLHAESDDFVHWEKSETALELEPQEGYDIRNWRDPFVVWDDEKEEYLLILGARKGLFKNTAFLSVVITLIQLFTSSFAAYGFSKLNFKGRDILFLAYIGTIAVPWQSYMIPQFIMMRKVNVSWHSNCLYKSIRRKERTKWRFGKHF
ncbi:hypothetical protein EfmAA242_19060 [Enterococcus faecium]|nr:hypothetical protein EfmAA242_19060 [Enterococcus faecium]